MQGDTLYNKILYRIFFLLSLILVIIGISAAVLTIQYGVGLWGINNNISWAFDITNFVFWIGISHAGTLISAILFLMRQGWRTAFNRAAEAMTLISLITAAFFPLIHTGRQWFASYWLFPYPNDMGIWINFKSPLIWDFFAILSYFIVSFIFLYVGLIPDFHILRNKRKIYSKLSLGWIGSSKQWSTYKATYLLLAGLLTPLVLSVHSIVSYDFAASIVPGWHTTLLPPYFVAGAIYSGIAAVIIIMFILSILYANKNRDSIFYKFGISSANYENFDKLGKLLLFGSMLIMYVYLIEYFSILYQPNSLEKIVYLSRVFGNYSTLFWIMFSLNIILPQFLWSKKFRQSIYIVIISFGIIVGMWLERFLLITVSLSKSYMTSHTADYAPSLYEIALTAGSAGIFLLLFLIFIKYFPAFTIHENAHSIRTGGYL